MAETETMAPRTMAFEIMVPYTMGTLDKKRIGLTSKTCAKRKETVSARVVGAGRATRAATQGAGLQLSGRRGHCRATSGGPRLEGSCGQNAGAPKAGAGGQRTGICQRWRRRPTCAHSEARASIAQRPSDHREMHESLCTDGGHAREGRSSAGAQGRRAE